MKKPIAKPKGTGALAPASRAPAPAAAGRIANLGSYAHAAKRKSKKA